MYRSLLLSCAISNFGDSALNCQDYCFKKFSSWKMQLSALSPKFIAAIAFLESTALGHAEAPKIVASFKPIHSLVASVMEGVGEPYLLVKGSASPHTYTMTPSDAATVQDAAAIFWIGHNMEAFLDKTVGSLGEKAKVVTLDEVKGLTVLPPREGGAFEEHAHEEEAKAEGASHEGHEHKAESAEAHEHGETDPHIWLDPENAKLMVREIEKSLTEIDAANAAAYKANADKTAAELDALSKELEATLTPAKGKPFITFHDAFQYFEKRFGVEAAGSVTVNPDVAPGAERVAALQAKVKELGAVCLFTEPNFDPKIMNVIMEGTNAKTATLDPEASGIREGPELYARSLRGIAAAMRECLG
jgi:zinc transport system substrate-binding protein